MCYYRLYIFLHCGHSTFSEMPAGFCKAAKDVTVRFSGSRQRSISTTSNSSSVYSRTDSMEPEERREPRHVSTTKAIRPCAEGQIHPLQTRRLERLCAVCQHDRDRRLRALELLNSEIQFKYQGGESSAQQDEPTQPNNSSLGVATWDMTTTFSSIVSSSSSRIRDLK